MCASCVAQGIAYVGASTAALRVMAARSAARRARLEDAPVPEPARSTPTPAPAP